MTDEDPLRAFDDLACCPSCAALAKKGTPRCPECGEFHLALEDVEARQPPPARSRERVEEAPKDPGFYSVDPTGDIPDEHFEGDEEAVTDWKESNIDFGLEDKT
jgi:hypothetical protein